MAFNLSTCLILVVAALPIIFTMDACMEGDDCVSSEGANVQLLQVGISMHGGKAVGKDQGNDGKEEHSGNQKKVKAWSTKIGDENPSCASTCDQVPTVDPNGPNCAEMKVWVSTGCASTCDTDFKYLCVSSLCGTAEAAAYTTTTTTMTTTTTTPAPGAWSYKPMTWIANLASPFPIQPCATIKNASGALLNAQDRQSLASENRTKCIQVFGTLIAGTAGANSNAMKYGANIVAQLLDPNNDGTVDEPAVAAKLDRFTNADAAWLTFGTDAKSEDSTMQPSASSQVWKAGSSADIPSIVLEESFHMVHQYGWAIVYPDAFGFKQWGTSEQSVACRCMREAQCAWYQHPENGGCTNANGTKCYRSQEPSLSGTDAFKIPESSPVQTPQTSPVQDVFNSSAIPGTCSTGTCAFPSCDCMEFFHKTFTTWLGNLFNGYDRMDAKLKEFQAQGLNHRAAIEKLMSQTTQCSKLLQLMKSPTKALPKLHVNETYQYGR